MPPIACDLSALTPAQRDQHAADSQQLFAAVDHVRELPDGYAYRLPADPAMWTLATAFIADERLCCPFFTFGLQLEPQGGHLWLSLSGSEEIKAFIAAELGGILKV